MGMAASQARYLALTARKTNTEYEGQQINQARTALANQSANLFNRLLDLEVPIAPKKTDYTEVQYSFSDGTNESVIQDWQQLSNADPNYNYIVNHYYYANLYTGSEKLLQDPKVHTENEVSSREFYDPKITDNGDGSYSISFSDGKVIEDCIPVNNTATNRDMDLASDFNDFAKAKGIAYQAGAIPSDDAVYGYQDATGTWHFYLREEIESSSNTVTLDPLANTYEIKTANGESYKYSLLTQNEINNDSNLQRVLEDYRVELTKNGEVYDPNNIYARHDDFGDWHFFIPAADNTQNPKEYSSTPVTYVGNSRATELTTLTIDQATELAQVLKDCPDSALKNYLSIDSSGNLLYGNYGVYTFDLHGKTYYTTEQDLYNSINGPYEATKPIEIQSKLPYYNASYIQTKIEETNHALLQTDENGRFTSVKFDDDSVVYSLNTETVTNDAAYEDAMNEYNYKVQQYEKTIADINAKTSIIQEQDRTLELRLKQLDTEQNALATEMDAVKKVIKDNVEKTFKTFSD